MMVAQIDKAFIKTNPLNLWHRILAYVLFEGRPITTKGRWINYFVFLFFRGLVKLPQLKSVKSPIFILGTGRSGTTILGMVLGVHHSVGFLNEPKAIWAFALSDEDLVGNYTNRPAKYRLNLTDYNSAQLEQIKKIYAAYLLFSGRNRVVDKYPELIFRTDFVRAVFPDAKFIFLSRNGTDTCASIKKWSKRLGQYSEQSVCDWWGENDRKWDYITKQLVPEHKDLVARTHNMDELNQDGRAAIEWILSMREGLRVMALDQENIMHVPYEQLCESPSDWMEKIRNFAKLSPCNNFISYGESVLKSAQGHEPLDLPNWLNCIFEDTQRKLDNLKNS